MNKIDQTMVSLGPSHGEVGMFSQGEDEGPAQTGSAAVL